MNQSNQLAPHEELTFRAACRGVGTFRVKDEEEESEALLQALKEMDPERAERALAYFGSR